ncbi:MAG: SurA N-terminal domain-containing protein [Desulfobacterales bacterium]
MLSILRKHAASTIIKIILALIIIVFVFWGFEGFRADRSGRVASVDGESITIDQYRQAYNNLLEKYRQQFGGQLNEELLEMFQLRQQALDMLINQRLMEMEAKKLNFRVSDQELAEYIRSEEAFQSNGVFDGQRYREILRRIRTTPEQFEEQQRLSLLIQKVQDFIISSAKVSDDEAMEFFKWNNATVKIKYALFDIQNYEIDKPDEEKLKTYFEQNQEDFRLKPTRQVQYIRIKPEDYTEKIEISDQEIINYYDDHPDEFKKEETVEARHVLIRVANDAGPEVVEEKRQEILGVLEKARAGEDFAKLAGEYSEGPTKENGGYLGVFARGSMVEAFEEAAFSMKAGEISDPVRTQFGWHIIKVEKVNESKILTIEEVKNQIKNNLFESRSQELAKEAAESVYEASFINDNLAEVAENHDIEVNKTGFFNDTGTNDNRVADRQKFAEIAFSLSDEEISEINELSDGFYIMQLIDQQESKIPDFAEVEEKVERKWIVEQQNEMAKKDATDFLEKLKSGSSMDELSKEFDVVVSESDFFGRNQPVQDLKNVAQISRVAFELSDQQRYPDSILRGEKGFYVIAFQNRKEPSADNFEQEKENIRNRLLAQKQAKIFEDWIAQIRKNTKISINDEFITG